MKTSPKPPDCLYIFIDTTNPMAMMNLRVSGRYSSPVLAGLEDQKFAAEYADGSADFLPFVPNPALSTGFMSPYAASAMADYRVEYDGELARRAFFKDSPSRLTGIFAFESMEVCEAVSQAHGWSIAQVQRFRPVHILRATRVNMDIVSLARRAYRRAMLTPESLDHLWRAYWSGAASYAMDLPSADAQNRQRVAVGATWEWVIDGVLETESQIQGQP